jgi:hypothetical protein
MEYTSDYPLRASIKPLHNIHKEVEIVGQSTQFMHPDVIAAQCLALITDPQNDLRFMPVDAFAELTRRNAELIKEPKESILDSLTRQAILMEAVYMRYLSKALGEKRTEFASAFHKMAISSHKALLEVQSAILILTKREEHDV